MQPDQIDDIFGNSVRLARLDQGMSQEELSAHLSIWEGLRLSQATIGKIERGDRKVTVGEAHALARALDVPLAELVSTKSAEDSVELGRRLYLLRTELVMAARNFECGQQLVAKLSRRLEAEDLVSLQHEVLESVEEVIELYRQEKYSDNARFLESQPRAADEEDAGSLLNLYRQKFGISVELGTMRHALEVINGTERGIDG